MVDFSGMTYNKRVSSMTKERVIVRIGDNLWQRMRR